MAEKIKGHIFFELFVVFFRVGFFTIGGGYAMLPMLRKEVVEKHGWATDEEMMDYFAIGQSTPGIIAVNTSTFIGYKKAGIAGAVFSTLGMVFPSWIIITLIAMFFDQFASNPYVQSAFMGIRVVVVVLIVNAVIKMGKKSIRNWLSLLLALGAFLYIVLTDFSPIPVIVLSGVLGIILHLSKKEVREA